MSARGGQPPSPEDAQRALRHDLRTPINQILGYSELLEEELSSEGKDEYVADLKRIQLAARKLLELVDRVGKDVPAPAPKEAAPLRSTGVILRAEVPEPAGAAPPSPEASGTVLVVDDNELNRDMLSRRLKAKGYEVDVAEDGTVALGKIAGGGFEAVLLDVMMPGISGIDVLKTVRQKQSASDLPIIMATAKDHSEDIVEALQLGANDYVTKPLDFPVVLARLQTALSLKRAKQRVTKLAEELEIANSFIRKTFGRYLSDDVVASLLETPEGLKLGGEKRSVTILMADLRGFTAMAEGIPPEKVVAVLNNYLGTMTRIIARYRGTIDEFIGDAILALFGAPIPGPDDARRAVACAIEMQLAMDGVNERNAAEGLPPLEMGIALNTGEVVVGNIGSETRAKYGVVGSHVNLSGRIESFTVGGQILLSESTRREAGEDVRVGRTMALDAKGFREPVTVHELFGLGEGLVLPRRVEELIPLSRPVPVRFWVLTQKLVDAEAQVAEVLGVSAREAELRGSSRPAVLANLRLRTAEAGDDGGYVYAKVVEVPEEAPDRFRIRFTSATAQTVAIVEKWCAEGAAAR